MLSISLPIYLPMCFPADVSCFFSVYFSSFQQLPVSYWVEFSIILFSLGLCGIFFNNSNFLTVLLNIEVMLLGAGLLYVGFSLFFFEPKGQLYALILLVLAAAESCLGLSLLVALFRSRRSVTQLELTHLSA